MIDHGTQSVAFHEHSHGKITVTSKVSLETHADLSMAYTPGVAQVVMEIARDPKRALTLTMKGNTVAVLSDGSDVLGMGNLGPLAALPVMEGKALLFKELAGVDAFPLCLAAPDLDTLVATCKALHPSFGGLCLEDLGGLDAGLVEGRLQDLGIPIFHDHVHGPAVAVLAGLINALHVSGRDFGASRVVINGTGPAAVSCIKLLLRAVDTGLLPRPADFVVCDEQGPLHLGRISIPPGLSWLTRETNRAGLSGSLADAVAGAQVFVGMSTAGALTTTMVRSMASRPIIFALANPVPEIDPRQALEAGAFIVATRRLEFPNAINSALVFPGLMRGALDAGAHTITPGMLLAAARALAIWVTQPRADCILPDALDRRVAYHVAEAVAHAARLDGVIR